MVLLERIELSASPLPRVCSTTELQQHWAARVCGRTAAYDGKRSSVSSTGLPQVRSKSTKADVKDKTKPATPGEPTREERLAEQLRANLKRRKAQARAVTTPPVKV